MQMLPKTIPCFWNLILICLITLPLILSAVLYLISVIFPAVITRSQTSIKAMEQGLTLLKKGGLLSLCIYSGGDSGFQERDDVMNWLKQLDPRKYLVIRSDYYNRPNNPPIPVLVIRLK